MDKDFLIKICLGVYRVTDFFPENEPLKSLIREKANEILAELICNNDNQNTKQALEKIGILQAYFEIAKTQNWLDQANFFVLEKEYDKIIEQIKADKPDKLKKPLKQISRPISKKEETSNNRYNKIIETLKQKQKVQVQEFKDIFPNISKRTLRRDFDFLISQKLVERQGQGKYTFYKIKAEV